VHEHEQEQYMARTVSDISGGSPGRTPTGAIAGGVLAVLAAIVALVGGLLWKRRRRRRSRGEHDVCLIHLRDARCSEAIAILPLQQHLLCSLWRGCQALVIF
jgi:hypothetical protein